MSTHDGVMVMPKAINYKYIEKTIPLPVQSATGTPSETVENLLLEFYQVELHGSTVLGILI